MVSAAALGALLVASSERGIVSIMSRDTQSRLIRELGARFPKAKLVPGEARSAAIVAEVGRYIAAPYKCAVCAREIRLPRGVVRWSRNQYRLRQIKSSGRAVYGNTTWPPTWRLAPPSKFATVFPGGGGICRIAFGTPLNSA